MKKNYNCSEKQGEGTNSRDTIKQYFDGIVLSVVRRQMSQYADDACVTSFGYIIQYNQRFTVTIM